MGSTVLTAKDFCPSFRERILGCLERLRLKRAKMECFTILWTLSSAFLLSAISVDALQAQVRDENGVKSAVFFSPAFILGPGFVQENFYYNMDFPRGHIALKDFSAEVVDEVGNAVPLDEIYLHHWLMIRYLTSANSSLGPYDPHFKVMRNAGICQGNKLLHYFGFGSDTHQTRSYVPDPYGIEVGNPAEIPDGYEERWLMNVHTIDTRGVADRQGCLECRCDLYNSTEDEYGRPLPKGYIGGMRCCPDKKQCKMKQGIENIARRKLYLRYTVKWVEWHESIVPVKTYVFDATDTGERSNSTDDPNIGCQVEYQVLSCGASGLNNGHCIDSKKANLIIPRGGNLIYAAGHLHQGGIGISLYGQDGRLICYSVPIYGDGKGVGNEEGYVVGMSTCYPKPGSVKLADGERLSIVATYNNTEMHSGVMGLFTILVDETRTQLLSSDFPDHDRVTSM